MNTSSITDPLQKCTSASQAENFDTGANDDEEKEARFTDPVPRPDDLAHDRIGGMSAISVQNNSFSFSSPTFAADNTLYESSMMMDSIDLSGSISCCLQNRFHDPEDNINPFGFYSDDPINNALTAKNLCAPCHNNESKMGEGAMTEINEYERIYLYGLFSHGSCAPQNHDGNLERKPIARDSISFQSSNSSSQYATKEDKVPTPYLNSRDKYTASPVPGSSTLYSLSESFNPDWNRTEAQVKSNAPPVVKRRSLTRKLLKPVPVKTHKKRSEKVKDIPKGSNHTRSKSAIKFQTRDVVAKLPLAHQQIIEKARTTRKQDALRTWFQRLNDLMKFRDENGHANVPQQYSQNHALGIWVNKQRMEKKAKDAGEKSSMTDDKAKLLEDIGFVWAKRKGQNAWEQKFLELQLYSQKHGHCNVPTKNNSNNKALGRWVSTQRANYKKLMGSESLTKKISRMDCKEMNRRISRLNAINFSWSLLSSNTQSKDVLDNDSEK